MEEWIFEDDEDDDGHGQPLPRASVILFFFGHRHNHVEVFGYNFNFDHDGHEPVHNSREWSMSSYQNSQDAIFFYSSYLNLYCG